MSGEVEVAGGGLVDVPEDVGGDGIEAHGARHFEAGVPVLAGDAGVVEFAGEDFEGLAVESEVVPSMVKVCGAVAAGWARAGRVARARTPVRRV